MQTNKDILQELDTWHQHYTKIQHSIHEKIQELRTTIKNQNDTIHTLKQQLKNTHNQEDYKQKYDEAQEHLDKEKERLTKLYQKYWETQNELEHLQKEISQWHDWYDSNRDTFEKLFHTAPAMETKKAASPEKDHKPTATQKSHKKIKKRALFHR